MSPENLMVHDDKVYIIDMGMCLRIPSSFQDDGVVDDYYRADDPTDPHHRWNRERRPPSSSRRSLILPQTPCGKWYYLSPEVCLSERPFDGPAVDLWAAGVILFVMLTGSPPWEEPRLADDNFRLMTTGHMGRMLEERRAGLSADAADLLQRMLYLDPADRLSLEQVRAHPWMTHPEHILP
jgi:serine/threonine protein kinase